MLVALEGIDGSGKSTIAKRLVALGVCSGREIRVIDKHTRRPIREVYKRLIEGSADFPGPVASLLLGLADYDWVAGLAASSAQEVCVFDRYIYSVFADALALGVSLRNVRGLIDLFRPSDLTVFFRISVPEAAKRKSNISLAEAGGPSFMNRFGDRLTSFLQYQQGVADAYSVLVRERMLGSSLIELDGTAEGDSLFEAVVMALNANCPALRSDGC